MTRQASAASDKLATYMKVTVTVMPKDTVLDPQGDAVGAAMQSLGFEQARNVRVGQVITFEVPGDPADESLRAQIDRICDELLSNPVIQQYSWTLHP